jgi:predicted TIM-barrel fold metal-dependent hydrolase
MHAMHAHLGIERAVMVQAIVHGTDNGAMLDAIARYPQKYRGVALVPDDVTPERLKELHAGGIRGVRYHFMPHLGESANPDLIRSIAERIAPLGWHVQLHLNASSLPQIHGLLKSLPVPFVIDHMGRTMVADGLDQQPLADLLDVLKLPNAWVKISGAERISAALSQQDVPYGDAVPIVHRILETTQDRVVWGTDWPHPNVREVPDDGKLADLLGLFSDDPRVMEKVLVDNPTKLYWYD